MRKAGVVPCNFLYFPHKVCHYQINLGQKIIIIYVPRLRILSVKHKAQISFSGTPLPAS